MVLVIIIFVLRLFNIPSSQRRICVNQPQRCPYRPSLMEAICFPSIPVHGALKKNYHAMALPLTFGLYPRGKFISTQNKHS